MVQTDEEELQLRVGSTGPAVAALQEFLIEIGRFPIPEITGIYDKLTVEAMRTVQRDAISVENKYITGNFDARTIHAMAAYYGPEFFRKMQNANSVAKSQRPDTPPDQELPEDR